MAHAGHTPDAQEEHVKQNPSRAFQLERWIWDVFVCHAGEDKPLARLLRKQMLALGLRCFVDEDSLMSDDNPAAMEAAVRSTQIAVVLLSEQFFIREAPQRELRWFVGGHTVGRNTMVPVFLGITVERCRELAEPAGLTAVCEVSGVRHAGERKTLTGVPVRLEETLHRIIHVVRNITGV